LAEERAAKEEEIKRLTRTQEELSKSLQDEIAKGNITIQQVRDQLTINMVDRVLFDSGQAQVKPAGLKVLKQVSDVLNKITDKQIRIEGHTDNVPISAKLQDKFKSNWELSTTRATTVVRYLTDHGGISPQYLSAVGYADTHPVASNDTEAGRASNRRIEIVLYPRDLSKIAGPQAQTAIPTSLQ
jgi:chemotaxis protein MotB